MVKDTHGTVNQGPTRFRDARCPSLNLHTRSTDLEEQHDRFLHL
jgi:hypothetical protein